jgi:hypothetical protein
MRSPEEPRLRGAFLWVIAFVGIALKEFPAAQA